MQDHPTARAASFIGSRLKAYAARFYREYGGCAVFGLLYGAVLYALMMSQQLTNTFDGLWHQNYHRAGAAELSSGRWVLAGIDRLLMGMHAEPIASIAALVLFIAGFLLVLDLFRLKRKPVCCLCLALFLSSTLISNTLSYRFTHQKKNKISSPPTKEGKVFPSSSRKQESRAARFMRGLPTREPKILKRKQVLR